MNGLDNNHKIQYLLEVCKRFVEKSFMVIVIENKGIYICVK